LNDRRILDHRRDDISVRCIGRDASIFYTGFGFSQNVKRAQAGLFDQPAEFFFCKRLVKIIDFFVINAVFPKQRRQISACRSGRLFVDGDLIRHIVETD
jgi:hypothetical protein